jgi:deoxyribonuclease V
VKMHLQHEHPWDLSPEAARQVQEGLRALVAIQPLALEGLQRVAGVDASFSQGKVRAAAVVLEFASLQVEEQASAEMPLRFPYIPGLLSFREAPAILAALEQLSRMPDLLIVDGHGLAHPRRFGIACHLGVLLDLPAIGCAKSILVGHTPRLGPQIGSLAELEDQGEIIGVALRTRQDVRPVYVSVGHRIDLASAAQIVLACCKGYRLPEPARLAHHLASKQKATNPC